MEQTTRHQALPQHLSAAELPEWIRLNHVERFTDERKRFFTEEEKNDFEHESALSGREKKKLDDMKKLISSLMLKGNSEERTFVIPETLGTKVLDRNRNQNYDLIEKGYEVEEVELFSIPDTHGETMEFFTLEGENVAERSRELTARERHLYLGVFAGVKKSTLSVHNDELVDENSGEVFQKTGTED